MNYNELITKYPCIDLFLEIFKGLAPTIVAVLAIIINNIAFTKREKKSRKINRAREIRESKIDILNEMLNKYIDLSQLFWISGQHLILFLSCTDDTDRNKERGDFEQSLYQCQFKAQEIVDYYKSMMKQYDFEIDCDTSLKDTNEYVEKLISLCEKYADVYMNEDSTLRNKLMDEAAFNVQYATGEIKIRTNAIMESIGKKIKELYEQKN